MPNEGYIIFKRPGESRPHSRTSRPKTARELLEERRDNDPRNREIDARRASWSKDDAARNAVEQLTAGLVSDERNAGKLPSEDKARATAIATAERVAAKENK
jgi:hypothetical protein